MNKVIFMEYLITPKVNKFYEEQDLKNLLNKVLPINNKKLEYLYKNNQYCINISNYYDTLYFYLKISINIIDKIVTEKTGIEVLSEINSKVISCLKKKYYVTVSNDDISKYYSKKLYAYVNKLENSLRRLIYKVLIKTHGNTWIKIIDDNWFINKSHKKQFQSKTPTKKIEKGLSEFYLLNLLELPLKQNEEIEDFNLYCDNEDISNMKNEIINKARRLVSHNKQISKEEFTEYKKNINKLIIIIDKALITLDEEYLSNAKLKEVLNNMDKELTNRFKNINHPLYDFTNNLAIKLEQIPKLSIGKYFAKEMSSLVKPTQIDIGKYFAKEISSLVKPTQIDIGKYFAKEMSSLVKPAQIDIGKYLAKEMSLLVKPAQIDIGKYFAKEMSSLVKPTQIDIGKYLARNFSLIKRPRMNMEERPIRKLQEMSNIKISGITKRYYNLKRKKDT